MTGRILLFSHPPCTTKANHPPHPPQTLESPCPAVLFLAEGWPHHPPQCRGCTLRRPGPVRRVAEGASTPRRVPHTHPPHLSAQLTGSTVAICGGCGGSNPLPAKPTAKKEKTLPAAGHRQSQRVAEDTGVVGLPATTGAVPLTARPPPATTPTPGRTAKAAPATSRQATRRDRAPSSRSNMERGITIVTYPPTLQNSDSVVSPALSAVVATTLDMRLYRIPEAMERLSMSRSIIYRLLRSGRLRSVKQGRTRLIPADAIGDYIALLEQEAEAAR